MWRKTLRLAGTGLLALVLLTLPSGTERTLGQRPTTSSPLAKPPASLESLLATALKYNPEIRAAEAKIRDHEIDLSRTRLRVMQRVIAIYHSLLAQQAEIDSAGSRVKRLTDLVRSQAIERANLDEAQQLLTRTRAKRSELEAELPYVLGRPPLRLDEAAVRSKLLLESQHAPVAIPPAMATRIRKALDRAISADYKDQPLGEVLRDLAGKTDGIALQRNLALAALDEIKVTLRLGKVPLGLVLLALKDTIPGMRILARNYGLLVTWEHQVPIGTVRLFDFWKNGLPSVPQAAARTSKAAQAVSLDEMLKTAMRYNPDIRVAEAKRSDDEADLNRTRLLVMQRIIAAHRSMRAGGARSHNPEELERLLGKRSSSLAEEAIRNEFQISTRSMPSRIRPRMAARLRKALDSPIKVAYQTVTFGQLLRDLAGKTDVTLQHNLALADLDRTSMSMRLGEVPLGAALLALQDTIPGLRVVARNYGILITWEHQVPYGAVRLIDFWKNEEPT
jgi:hypothetical protein